MNEELYFNDELSKCLNAAGLSDCGENDAWNYWYQRIHKAHDQAIDMVTEAQQAENAKLRELVKAAWKCIHSGVICSDCRLIAGGCTLQTAMRELGIEVNA